MCGEVEWMRSLLCSIMQLVTSIQLTVCSLSQFVNKFHYKLGLNEIFQLFIHWTSVTFIFLALLLKSRIFLYCLVTLLIFGKQCDSWRSRSSLCSFLWSLQVFNTHFQTAEVSTNYMRCLTQLYLIQKHFCFFSAAYFFFCPNGPQPYDLPIEWLSVSYMHRTATTAAVLYILVLILYFNGIWKAPW